MTLVGISAGHGGLNHGTSHGDLREHILTLEAANRSAARLAWSSLVEPVLVRQEDIDLEHVEKAGIAKRAGCAAVVEIHLNNSSDPSRGGAELYHHAGDLAGRALGVEILALLDREWRVWRSDNLHEGAVAAPGALAITTAYHDAGIPCALLEVCFLSNAGDRAWLTRPETRDEIAYAICSGCEAWAKTL